MFSTRSLHRLASRARSLATQAASRRTHTGVRGVHLAVGAGSAVLASSLAYLHLSHASAESDSSSTALTHTLLPLPDDVQYYKQTASHTDILPQTAEEIAQHSLEQLAALYDPEQKDKEKSTLAHAAVWGAPPPSHSFPSLPLLFTSTDVDPFHRHLELLVRSAQNRICNNLLDIERMSAATLTDIDGQPLNEQTRLLLLNQTSAPGQFRESIVQRPGGTGGGIERVLQGGRVFSKAGVNISITNARPPGAVLDRLKVDHPSIQNIPTPSEPFNLWTASISLVLHPVSPNVPTCHANYRFFQLTFPDGKSAWWFGGGSDLTPTCVEDEDATFFHSQLRQQLAPFDPNYYPNWKKWCDKYFYIPHRGESRGVGGIFFDDLHSESREHYTQLITRLSEGFSATYFPIVLKRKDQPFTAADLAFQQLRRGRYAEFNLVYDKGTTYGLAQPTARPEAILMSMPPIARFAYKQQFDEQKHKYTKGVLSNPKEW